MHRSRVAWMLLALASCARRPADERAAVTLIYSAELRGAVASPALEPGGLARRATLVDQARLESRAVIQVDAGDLMPASGDPPGLGPEQLRDRATLILRAYARMGVDAITVGERELALGVQAWRALCETAAIPVVAANLVGGDGRAPFPATRLVSAGDVTVGVFGILELDGKTSPPADVQVTEPAAAARAAVRVLRGQGARLIVGLFHVAGGLPRARAIAATAGGVDVVVLGHEGPAAPPGFVRAGAGGLDLGRIDVRMGRLGAPALSSRVLVVGRGVSEQTGVRLLVRAAEGPIPRTFAESVALLSKAAGVRTYGEKWTYASTSLCQGCHLAESAQWMTTDHARAYETLEAAGREHDPACMGCHMTGFLLPGGAQNFESAAQFANVGCEACHGPSVTHVVSMDKRRGTSRTVPGAVCLGCHTPDQSERPMDLPAALSRVLGPGHGRPDPNSREKNGSKK